MTSKAELINHRDSMLAELRQAKSIADSQLKKFETFVAEGKASETEKDEFKQFVEKVKNDIDVLVNKIIWIRL